MDQYKLLPEAENDLENIWRYTAQQWSVEQAMLYINKLDNAFQLLAETPLICRERREFFPPVRIQNFEKHLIVYLIEDTYITIVRVLHGSMDIDAHLEES
ncbi:MAG: type II toxin-antitoxin system RelE/ParE family toxin [Pseudomonadales bacterium]|nr:type II toxin-antitoxin system RelE/ParE family toxin [Pseudomonadales bacterium]MBL4867807.1 type II toxin-antitoxin system RelE/ParE family toxin [Pseudomonadales bacterium]